VLLVTDAIWALDRANYSYSMGADNDVHKTYVGITNPVITFGHVKLTTYNETIKAPYVMEVVAAEECVLTLCERSTELKVVNGTARTQVEAANFGVISWEPTSTAGTDSRVACWRPSENVTISNATCGYFDPDNSAFCPLGLNPGLWSEEDEGNHEVGGYMGALADALVAKTTMGVSQSEQYITYACFYVTTSVMLRCMSQEMGGTCSGK